MSSGHSDEGIRHRRRFLTSPDERGARVLNIRGVCLGLRRNSERPATRGNSLIPFGFFRPAELPAQVSRIKVPDGVVNVFKGSGRESSLPERVYSTRYNGRERNSERMTVLGRRMG